MRWGRTTCPSGAQIVYKGKETKKKKTVLSAKDVTLKNLKATPVNKFLLLVFSVTPFKIDQNKKQSRSIDKVQNLGNERKYIYKDPRQDSGQRNI